MGPRTEDAPRTKAVYTTGEVARICSISQQTVIRCFDSGRLRGFRVPGSKFRRIPHGNLLLFMKENDIPLDRLERSATRVLVIDDDREIVEMIRELLTRNGRFEVRSGSTGFEAGLLVRDFLPDVLLLDFKLPDLNGDAVCRSVRAQSELSHTKIIIISGVADQSEIDSLLEAGADRFIKKPFTIGEVIEEISQLLNV